MRAFKFAGSTVKHFSASKQEVGTRNPNYDVLKPFDRLSREMASGAVCKVCGDALTTFRGPGEKTLCRTHQLQDPVYITN